MHDSTAMVNRRALAAIVGVSGAAVGFILWMVYLRQGMGAGTGTTSILPAINATFNAVSAACIVMAVIAIRRGLRRQHVSWMLGAVAASTLFLVTYIAYHWLHGETRFAGEGWIRPVYFFILISHIVLSVPVLPMVLTTLYLAWSGTKSGEFARHRRLARWTYPLWLYVSVTGVLVFALLRWVG